MLKTIAALLVSASGAFAQSNIQSTFDTNPEGWLVAGYSYAAQTAGPIGGITPTHDPLNGQPAGSIRMGDQFGETCVVAPAQFLGDLTTSFDGEFSYDIFLRFTDGVDYPAVILVGATDSLYNVRPTPPLDQWHHVSVPFATSEWRINSWRGTVATQSQLLAVLSNVQAILINTEWKTGPDDTNIDNVMLTRPGATCYADCDQSTGTGVLDIFDFLCFQNAFVAAEPYACDCDTSTGPAVCDIFDFLCFQNAFVAGCP
jgi:Laminin B (Domain IV)